MNRTIDADVVLSVAFNSDGTKMLSSQYNSGRGSVTVYDAATGVAAVSIEPTPLGAVGVFSSDGSTILLTGEDGNIAVADAATGSLLPIPPRQPGGSNVPQTPAALSPDGAWVAAARNDGEKIVDLGTANNVFEARFNQEGTRIATNEFDGNVYLFDAATFAEVGDLSVAGTVGTILFSPDGTLLATETPAFNQTFNLWSTADGRSLGEYEGATVSFDPTGQRIATTSGTKLKTWELG